MAKRILQLEGVNELEFNGKRIKGTELTLHLVYRNEFGVEVSFHLKLNTSCKSISQWPVPSNALNTLPTAPTCT